MIGDVSYSPEDGLLDSVESNGEVDGANAVQYGSKRGMG